MISLEYIISLFDLSIGDYIDIDIDNINDNAKEYEEYVICERIEEAFRELDKNAEAAKAAKAAKAS
jgi:hypothetical protein